MQRITKRKHIKCDGVLICLLWGGLSWSQRLSSTLPWLKTYELLCMCYVMHVVWTSKQMHCQYQKEPTNWQSYSSFCEILETPRDRYSCLLLWSNPFGIIVNFMSRIHNFIFFWLGYFMFSSFTRNYKIYTKLVFFSTNFTIIEIIAPYGTRK